MPRKPSIDEQLGEQLFQAYQRLGSIAGAAREVGVSESAARRYLAELPKAATPTIASQRQIIESAGASLFDTRAALEESYRLAETLVTQAMANDMANPKAVQAAAGALRTRLAYVEAAMRMLELMCSVEEQRKFQQAVLEGIRDADEPTYERIVARLKQLRALGLALPGY